MGQEVLELIKGIDMTEPEAQLALHCAPLLTGLKASNLLIIQKNQVGEVRCLLKNMNISYLELYSGEQKSVLLLYRFQLLNGFLMEKSVQELLHQFGYQEFTFQKLLCAFAARYRAYREKRAEFPHEMGLFLAYPPEDVQGFIENKGKNCLLTGYWKVYQKLPQKAGVFQKFDQAKEALLWLLAHGVSISEATKMASD